MKKLGVYFKDDVFLLRKDESDTKIIRRNEVFSGSGRMKKHGSQTIIAYFGDAMGDFPDDNSLKNLFKLSSLSEPSLVQFIHRNLAYIIGIFYLYIFYKIYKNKIYDLYKSVNILGFFILLQIILGIFTILYGAQIYISSMHQLSSIFLVSSCVYFFYLNTKFN